jgi:hypothetical protein
VPSWLGSPAPSRSAVSLTRRASPRIHPAQTASPTKKPGLVLLIDDLGIEKQSDWTEETLFGIIDARWRNCRPTIVTTNLTPLELRNTVGSRVYDRLKDGATALTIPGQSRRAGAAA